MPQRYDVVIFDLDGTLIDSRRDIAEAVNFARGEEGLAPLPIETVSGFVGEGVRRLMERSLGPVPEERIEKAIRGFNSFYAAHLLDFTKPYPDVLDLLPRLPGRKALVSNKPHALTVEIVRRLGLAPFLDPVLGPEATKDRKPSPAPFLQVLEQHGVPGSRALAVGDSLTDLQAARGAGMSCCLVTYGFTPAEKVSALNPDHLIDRFEALRDLLA